MCHLLHLQVTWKTWLKMVKCTLPKCDSSIFCIVDLIFQFMSCSICSCHALFNFSHSLGALDTHLNFTSWIWYVLCNLWAKILSSIFYWKRGHCIKTNGLHQKLLCLSIFTRKLREVSSFNKCGKFKWLCKITCCDVASPSFQAPIQSI